MREREEAVFVERPAEPRATSRASEPAVRFDPASPSPGLGAGTVLRLQRSAGNAATAAYLERDDEARSPVYDVVGRGGTPLDDATRATMEEHLGADFSDVRLHVDRRSAESVQAAAYTVGNDIVVHPDHFQPGTPQAQRTLAHELTHVVQQRSGPVDGTPAPGGIQVSDPSDRFEQEAERSASAVLASARSTPSDREPVQRLALQREQGEEDEDEEVQRVALQRAGEEDQEEQEEA
ncbi:MAG TPA: DUF4157 domain-containing protein [Acidimicrobiales bacterium]|nr:DUF4157 domain-containing protein [Acidimicrobiales bacterium]